MRKIGLSIVMFFSVMVLVSCNNQDENQTLTKNVNYTNVKYGGVVDQSPSAKAKDIVSEREETTDIRAVNSDKDLYLAFNVDTFDSFRIDKIEADVKKELKKKFPDYNVQVSTDKKVFLELEALEAKLANKKVKNKKELEKNLNHIKHLKNDK